jgi:hypothetical protein
MQIVRKLEMRTRSWRRGVTGRKSFKEVGEIDISSSWFERRVVSGMAEVVGSMLNWQRSCADHRFPTFNRGSKPFENPTFGRAF